MPKMIRLLLGIMMLTLVIGVLLLGQVNTIESLMILTAIQHVLLLLLEPILTIDPEIMNHAGR